MQTAVKATLVDTKTTHNSKGGLKNEGGCGGGEAEKVTEELLL
jgi:hypothetical protein